MLTKKIKKNYQTTKRLNYKNCTELSESARQYVSTNQSSSEIFHVSHYTARLYHAVQDTV